MINEKSVQDYIFSKTKGKRKTTVWNRCRESNSLILTGGAIIRNGYATLIVGPGTDNLLEATYQFPDQVDGIIGNGRAILFGAKENVLYSVHFPEEVRSYFREKYTERTHKPLMSAQDSGKIVIMNLKPRKIEKGMGIFHSVVSLEVGKDIEVNLPSKSRKRIRNFASKASYVREFGDIFLSWKERMAMSFEDVYETMKPLSLDYYTVVTPFYDYTAWNFVQLKNGRVNPHEPVLGKLLDEKII